jgi:ER-bound oxygenase mpaB/B'/Rubber oxygenase, catalytic domain
MISTAPQTWPSDRSSYSAILLQFGKTRADLLAWALHTGDPLADAVAEEVHVLGRDGRAQLQRGMVSGLAALADPPPAIAAFLTDTERLPSYADNDLLDHGSVPFFTVPSAAHVVSLSAGALIRVYESPSISQVLATSGRLIEGADRRIRETGKWVSSVMLPGSLRPGGPGYIATLQVRVLHANMRRLARSRGFDEAAYGAPINQVDLGRTWMDFTLTSLRAEELMGFGLTSREAATLYRYWWLLADLLGIDARLIQGIRSNAEAARVDELFAAVTGPLIDESVTLAHATLESITDLLHEALHIPESVGTHGLAALARLFHGPAMSDELQIESSRAAEVVLNAAIARVRTNRTALRSDPVKWQAAIAANLAQAHGPGAAEPALYEAAHPGAEV